MLALVALTTASAPSFACGSSPLLDGDIGAATVIVEGRVESATGRPELFSGRTGPKSGTLDPFIPVELSVRVARPLKGTVTDPFVFFSRADRPLDGGVPREADGSIRFVAGTGCAWPDKDPTGAYTLLLLANGYGNRLVPLRSSGTFAGPDDPALVARRGAILARLPEDISARTLPAPLAPDAGPDVLMGAVVAAPLSLLAVGAVVLVAGVPARRPAPRTRAQAATATEPELAPT